jgi:hypothetical protein
MKPGRAGTMTHDYKRHGTTTLLAALNILDGTVIGHNMKRHRHQEFVRFLNTIEAQVPKRKAIHAIIDNGHAGVAVDGGVAQQEDYGTIEAWRRRPIEGEHPYVYLDGIVLKHSWADEVRLIAVQAA